MFQKAKEDSKEQDSKKEVINRILSAASSVMKQEEQKVKKLENGKPELNGARRQQTNTYGNSEPFPSTSVPQNVIISNMDPVSQGFAQNAQNVSFVTTPLPQNKSPMPMKSMIQVAGNSQIRKVSSPRIPTQVSHNIESAPLPGSSNDQLKPLSTETQMITIAATNSRPMSTKANSFAVVTHHELPRKNAVKLIFIISCY